jgi:hypothetical protein
MPVMMRRLTVDEEDADGDMKLAASIWAIGKKLISQDAEDEERCHHCFQWLATGASVHG